MVEHFFRRISVVVLLALGATVPQNVSAQDKLSIGVVNFDSSAITANQITEAIRSEGQAVGWTVLVQDPKSDLAQANALCTQYVTRQVDAIIINIFQATQMAQCIAYAGNASIPVFFLGSQLTEGAAGTILMTLSEPINEAFLKMVRANSDVKAIAFTYQPGAPCREREENMDALIKSQNLTFDLFRQEIVVPGIVTSSLAATQAWLNGHPAAAGEKLAVWACTSDAALGAISAMKQAGRDLAPIYTWDISDLVFDALKSKEIAATLWIDAKGMGKQVVKMVRDYKADKKIRQEQAAYAVVTPENVEQFLKDHPNP